VSTETPNASSVLTHAETSLRRDCTALLRQLSASLVGLRSSITTEAPTFEFEHGE